MTLRFEVDTSKLTVGDMLLIEDAQDGNRPMHNMIQMMERFLVDENGKPIPQREARRLLGELSIDDFQDTAQTFAGAIQRKAIPPAISGS